MDAGETELPLNDFQQVSASFGVRGDSLIPAELTRLLGIQPSHAFAKGDEYTSKTGTRTRPWGVWQLRSDAFVSSSDLQDHARFILEQLEPKKDIILKWTSSADLYVEIRFWCEVEAETVSFAISSCILARLATLCKEFNFSFIGCCE